VFIIRLLSGRRKKIEECKKKLRNPEVEGAYRHLSNLLREEIMESNPLDSIRDLEGGGWEIVLRVFPHSGSYERRTYSVRKRDGAYQAERKS